MSERAEFRTNALWQLTRARTLGFLREPEAVFWVFVFPIVMAFALGIAFRNQKPQPLPVAVVPGAGAETLHAALAAKPELRVIPVADDHDADRALRTGKITALVVPMGSAASTWDARIQLDPTRQEARIAEGLIHDALERAAGRI